MKRQGFSLLELSIVLVIIGLIAGGIVAGSSMIRGAEMRALITEFGQYQTSVNTFRDKYLGYPGELKNATAFWGEMGDAAAGACPVTQGTGTETCDGDGNGQIDAHSTANERYTFWQHLANAGLISGTYSGVQGSDSNDTLPGVNAPESKLSGSGWHAAYLGTSSGVGAFTVVDYGNALYFGAKQLAQPTYDPALKPEELWNLDTKIDDGKPGKGKVIAFRIDECTDAADGTDIDADYALTNDAIECAIFFRDVF